MKGQKEKALRKLPKALKKAFSGKELREIKDFLARIANLLVEGCPDGDLS